METHVQGQGPSSYHELLLSEHLRGGQGRGSERDRITNFLNLVRFSRNFQPGKSQNYDTLRVNYKEKERERERGREGGGREGGREEGMKEGRKGENEREVGGSPTPFT